MMKLGTVIPYLKKIQKKYKSNGTFSGSADIAIFPRKIDNFCYNEKYRKKLHINILAFVDPLKVVLINITKILKISAKLGTPDLLKMKVF